MRRIVVAGYIDKASKSGKGIFRKMTDQAFGFESLDFETDIFCLENDRVYTSDSSDFPNPFAKGRARFYSSLFDNLQRKRVDILYLRYPFATQSLVTFLARVKQNRPDIQIIMEWPTYPYHQEFQGLQKIKYYIDKYFQNQIFPYLDLAVVMGNDHQFQHVPTVSITNGYHCQHEEFVGNIDTKPNTWIAVGFWQKWHGLERIMYGLHEYYQHDGKKNIQLHILGEGPALAYYKKVSKDNGLSKNIKFHHEVTEAEKQRLLSTSSLAIGVLGSHTKNLTEHAPLKHRMYACAGLPFIYSTSDLDFDQQPFILRLPEEDKAIHIPTVLEWFNQREWDKKEIIKTSKQLLPWSLRCQKIISTLKEFKAS